MTKSRLAKTIDQLLTKEDAQKRLALLEEAVQRVEHNFALWRQAGIPERTIVILLAHSTKVSQRDIRAVLSGLENLYDNYFKDEEEP